MFICLLCTHGPHIHFQLKEEIAKVMGSEAPVESQCLIFAGKILKDDQSIESQAVKDGVTIHLVIRSSNKVHTRVATSPVL